MDHNKSILFCNYFEKAIMNLFEFLPDPED